MKELLDRHQLGSVAARMAPVGGDGCHDLWAPYRDSSMTSLLARLLAEPFSRKTVSLVVGPEARGFLLGILVAQKLGVGFAPARKAGRYLPGRSEAEQSLEDWERKTPTFLVQVHAVRPGDRVLLVDDWLTTGNQARAVRTIIERLGGIWHGCAVVVEEGDPAGDGGLGEFHSLLRWHREHERFALSPRRRPQGRGWRP